MKIDRLLSIVTYLLNRDIVSGKQLAEKFEVSERTIQRDIDSINMAGIPIVSIRGANGGYQILDTYKLSKQPMNSNDIDSISLALEGLYSVFGDEKISDTLEKVKSTKSKSSERNIIIDFSVVKENKKIMEFLKRIDEAIIKKIKIKFSYTTANNYQTERIVEPVILKYAWYTWYLVAYCEEKETYRIFKLIRMNNLEITDISCEDRGELDIELFYKIMNNDKRKTLDVILKCKKNLVTLVSEYLGNIQWEEKDDDFCEGRITVIEEERMWFAFLLSFGDEIEIIEPKSLKEKLIKHSKKIIDKYEIPHI